MATPEDITDQQTRLITYRRSLAHYLQQLARLGEAYAPPGVTLGIYEARQNIQRTKKILRSWNVVVENHPDDGDDTIVTTSPESTLTSPATIDRNKMRQVLIDYFNEEEIRDLTFDLSIDYDSLRTGSNKPSKVRELIDFMEKRGRYDDLVREVKRLRPNVT
jgi:hypothetical protein